MTCGPLNLAPSFNIHDCSSHVRDAWRLVAHLQATNSFHLPFTETLAPFSPREAKSELNRILHALAQPNPGDQPMQASKARATLSEKQWHALKALAQGEAFDADHRITRAELARIAEGNNALPDALNHAVADLGKKGLVQTKTGQCGGVWLTTKGRETISA